MEEPQDNGGGFPSWCVLRAGYFFFFAATFLTGFFAAFFFAGIVTHLRSSWALQCD
jgi:hypothetical protein